MQKRRAFSFLTCEMRKFVSAKLRHVSFLPKKDKHKMFHLRPLVIAFAMAALINGNILLAQTRGQIASQESERSDKFTGGRIEKAEFKPGEPNVRLSLNVPSFRLTLWQDGKEVITWYVGVGRKEFPLVIGERTASMIIWNPDWIPPNSDWVRGMSGVTPGEVIKASDKRNPIGKVKIPLGDS